MRTFLLIALLLLATPIMAWGPIGHRAAAEIGEHFLSSEARLAVREILTQEDLARASTWADFMRSDPSEFWQKTANPWHYVTVPAGQTYREAGAPPQGDAYTALQMFSGTLLDRQAEPAKRALALRFIVHIIADLHQPLHVGNGTDRGGNDFELTYFGRASNLHRLWDWEMIDRWQLSYTELADWLLADIDAKRFRAWNNPNPLDWIAESAALRDRVYPAERGLSWDYGFQWKSTIEERLAQAGVRTAAYLNALFAPESP